uniref:Beta-galactoside alpha-2,6-sialyltransferase 1 n=1 Tax=Scylla olivacea TaxID=85551 RepID=A0A0N7ZCA1_SCYOL
MRMLGLSVWLFLNLVFLGMGSYLYLLWVQYWRYARTSQMARSQDASLVEGKGEDDPEPRPGKPRFHSNLVPPNLPPLSRPSPPPPPTTTPTPPTVPPTTREQLLQEIQRHKVDIFVRLRRLQKERGSILVKHENRYEVLYKGRRRRGPGPITGHELLCALREAGVRTLRDGDEPFTSQGVSKHFPSTGLLEGRHFNTCVVVSSAGSNKGSHLGNFIDSHDAVVRFNDAPTVGFEGDVGTRTTLRIVNSRILVKPEFKFWDSPLYKDVAVLAWDPCHYSCDLNEWYKAPDFDFFPEYFRRRLMLPYEDLHMLHPASMWNIWDVLQRYTPDSRLLPNPPSTGFLGIMLMLAHCESVDVVEFVPSLRMTEQCHYWLPYNDTTCTFGGWHPTDTEKLTTLTLNSAGDYDTYARGFVRIPGFKTIACPTRSPAR